MPTSADWGAVEVRGQALENTPCVQYGVSLPSTLQGVELQAGKLLPVVHLPHTLHLVDEAALKVFQCQDFSLLSRRPELRAVIYMALQESLPQGQHWRSCARLESSHRPAGEFLH